MDNKVKDALRDLENAVVPSLHELGDQIKRALDELSDAKQKNKTNEVQDSLNEVSDLGNQYLNSAAIERNEKEGDDQVDIVVRPCSRLA